MLESIIRASLRQRVIVVVVALALMCFGVLSLQRLSVDAFPDVTNIQVQIATEAPGRSPEEVERFITVPIEIGVTGLPGLTEMRSLNKNGLSIITLVFNDATDIYFARQLVMERLIEVGSKLPTGITPVLGPVSSGLGEIYQYTIERADDAQSGALSIEELTERRTIQDWVVRPLLRSIPNVAEINSQGGYAKQYQILANPDRLLHYKLTLQDLYQAIARNNANSGGGILPHYAEQYLIRGVGLVKSLDDLKNIVLKEVDGTPVYVRDIAEVTIGAEVRQGAMIKNGTTEAVGGIVMMLRGGNAKQVVKEIQNRVAKINQEGMLPHGLKIVPFYDRSELVDSALLTVTKVLFEGVILVVLILFIFLGDLRSSLIVVGTLLLTPLITFMIMGHYNISANLMSLGGLAIAIGLMVDGSVVVVENTFHRLGHLREGESRLRAILAAAVEVGKPVIYGVSIIVLVFLPLMMLEGMEGKMFAPLAYTIAIALLVSLVLSLTLSPVLCSYILKGGADEDTKIIAIMKRPYLKLLHLALAHRKQTLMISIALLVGSLSLFPLLGKAFIPTMKEGNITPAIIRVPNISLEESLNIEFEAMRRVMEVPAVKMVVSKLGRGESPADPAGPNESDPIVTLKPRDQWPKGWNQTDFENAIRQKLKDLPSIELVMNQPIAQRVDEMVTGVRSQVAIKLFGDDLTTLKQKGDEIAAVLKTISGTTDLRVERVSGQQYLTIDIDRKSIARYGINASEIHDLIETAIAGKISTEIYEGERRFSALVRFPEEYRNNIEAIQNILVKSSNGAQVPLSQLATITVVDGPSQISRETAKRRIVIGANVDGRDLGSYIAEAQEKVLNKVKLPEGYTLQWGGQFENMERAMSRLMVIVPVTILAIFFLLFVLFNSVRYAALIILVLPFASIGGVIALFLTGEYLSVPASVGFIALWGIAVLNGVVLVSYIRSLRLEGMAQAEAITYGCQQRFRPVMMTATVAMLGLVPFLFADGPGSEVQRPLAIVVIGGLVSSTLLTLVVVPSLYQWFEEKQVEA